MPRCLISLGSNLGDRRAALDRAVELLRASDGISNLVASRWQQTAPVGGPAGQPDFLNGAAAFDTSLAPLELLAALQQIERQLGRTREIHWGPRTLDLDLLLYGDEQIDSPTLTVPHPLMAVRRFVLEPASEVAGEMRHPVIGRTIANLLTNMNHNQSSATPPVVTTRAELRAAVAVARRAGKTIGFVPTMGALHAGHVSLVEASRREQGFTVVSIFVNPMQFGPGEDFERYPRSQKADLAKLAAQQVDLVFAPPTEEVYRPGSGASVEPGPVAEPLEGRFRPGHFRGVATVVLKLFNLVTPDVAYFGRKDYQQTQVIRRMTTDFDLPIEVRVCPTVREPDGLALSSRNVYLSAAERQQALVLSRSLRTARELVERGERHAGKVLDKMRAMFAVQPEIHVEYIALADGDTLADATHIDRRTVALVAARVGKTRLIDNEPIGEAITE